MDRAPIRCVVGVTVGQRRLNMHIIKLNPLGDSKCSYYLEEGTIFHNVISDYSELRQ